jgi:hypothetical protein
MHPVILSILVLFQSLMFSANTWSFTGEVLEMRQVSIMGKPAQVALVRSADFDAWVIQRMDEGPFEVVLGNAAVGDRVRVSISGAQVSKNGVDWSLCEPADSNYCRLGALYDAGPFSGDWNVPISPSNEFIHWGHPNPSYHFALFWNTEKLLARYYTPVWHNPSTHRCWPRLPGWKNSRNTCVAPEARRIN